MLLSIGHWLGPQLPSGSGSVRGCDPLRMPCIGLRGVILVGTLAGGGWFGRAGVRRHARAEGVSGGASDAKKWTGLSAHSPVGAGHLPVGAGQDFGKSVTMQAGGLLYTVV